MSDDILARAEKALKGVTPGLWGRGLFTRFGTEVLDEEGQCIADVMEFADARFIADAPQLVTDLVAELRELRAEVEWINERYIEATGALGE